MTKSSKGGLALAKHISSFYANNPIVMVILAGGSVSRGCADEYSDLEVGVFWAVSPSVGARQAAIKSVGGELLSLGESPGNEKWGLKEVTVNGKSYLGTLMVSTIHLSVTEAEACLSDVIDRYDTEIDKHGLVFAIKHGFPCTVRQYLSDGKRRHPHTPMSSHGEWFERISGWDRGFALNST